MDEYKENFRHVGIRIAYYRKLKGYTQEEFSEILDVAASYYSQIEAPGCHKPISLRTLFRIADALDIEPYKLLLRD